MRTEADDQWISIGYLDQSSDAFRIFDDTLVVSSGGSQTGLIGDQSTSSWQSGTGTTESLVSPAKVKAAIQANSTPYTQPTSLDAVGTYAWCARTATGELDYITEGASYSGSSLVFSGVAHSSGNNILPGSGSNPSGTWRAMGVIESAFTGFNTRMTLFLRIS